MVRSWEERGGMERRGRMKFRVNMFLSGFTSKWLTSSLLPLLPRPLNDSELVAVLCVILMVLHCLVMIKIIMFFIPVL